jgi:DnaA N-terminal domain
MEAGRSWQSMLVNKAVGRDAATKKYDILTALTTFALSEDKHRQRQVMRLIALITSRYNWQRNELSMGQREIAKLWSVDERTVKRELAKLRSLGWLTVKRAGARGRVTSYGLELDIVFEVTRPCWEKIGPDFIDRMGMMQGRATDRPDSNVVPFSKSLQNGPQADGTLWSDARAILFADDPVSYGSWFHQLTEAGRDGDTLVLAVPTKFHASYIQTHLSERLISSLRRIDPSLKGYRLIQ